jgi:protein-disulfide isomerase
MFRMTEPNMSGRPGRLDSIASVSFILLCLVGIVVGISVLWDRTASPGTRAAGAAQPPKRSPAPAPPLPTTPIDASIGVALGSASARVTLIEYSDFKCPFCRTFANDMWPSLRRKYVDAGKVRFVFRNLPLDQLHPFARTAANTAACAAVQNQFWPMHDLMFTKQAQLDAGELAEIVKAVGLEGPKLSKCVAVDAARQVQSEEESGRSLNVTGTPTFFVGLAQKDGRVLLKQRLAGAQPIAQFEAALDRWLKEAEGR